VGPPAGSSIMSKPHRAMTGPRGVRRGKGQRKKSAGRGRRDANDPLSFVGSNDVLLGGNKARVMKLLNRSHHSATGDGGTTAGVGSLNRSTSSSATAATSSAHHGGGYASGGALRSSLRTNSTNFGRLTLDPLNHTPSKRSNRSSKVPKRRVVGQIDHRSVANGDRHVVSEAPPVSRLAWTPADGAAAPASPQDTTSPSPGSSNLTPVQGRPDLSRPGSASAGSPVHVVKELKAQRRQGQKRHPLVPERDTRRSHPTQSAAAHASPQAMAVTRRANADARLKAKEKAAMHQKILANLQVLPLSFLRQYRDHPDYRDFLLKRAIDVFEATLQRSRFTGTRYAFDLWLMFGLQKRREEKAARRRQKAIYAALHMLDEVASRTRKKETKKYWRRWLRHVGLRTAKKKPEVFPNYASKHHMAASKIQAAARAKFGFKPARGTRKRRRRAGVSQKTLDSYVLRIMFFEYTTRNKASIETNQRARARERRRMLIVRIRATRRIQRCYRGSRVRRNVAKYRRRRDAARHVQRIARGFAVRKQHLIAEKKAALIARKKLEWAASIVVTKVCRMYLALGELRYRRAQLIKYHRHVDLIQDTWKRFIRAYRTKQHRDAAVAEMEEDKAEAMALLLEMQVKATILMQKIVRGKQKHPVIPARRFERDRLIAVRIEAAEHIQRRRRRELERRYWRKKYDIKRKAMLVRVAEAKQKVRPWVDEYPLVTMRQVGDLLDRPNTKVCLWEILKLHSIAAYMKEHKKRDIASLKIQCQYRMYKGRESRAMLKRIADEKQRQLELKSSRDMQRIVRGYLGLCAAESVRVRNAFVALLTKLRHISSFVRGLNAPKILFDKFETAAGLLPVRAGEISREDRFTMKKAIAWGEVFILHTISVCKAQRTWRGHRARTYCFARTRAQQHARLSFKRVVFPNAIDRVRNAGLLVTKLPRGFLARRLRRALKGQQALLGLNYEKYPQIRENLPDRPPKGWDSADDVQYVLQKAPETLTYREIDFMYQVQEFWEQYELEENASVTMQRMWHGYLARLEYKERVAAKLEEDRRRSEAAALAIMRVFRGMKGRRSYKKKKFAQRRERALREYIMHKRTEQEKQEWKRRLSQVAVRERILREHRERMEEEKLRSDLAWKEKKAHFAAQMLAAAQEEKQSYATLQVLNAWRQTAEADGRVYYYNDVTGESTYDPPSHWKFPHSDPKKVLYWRNMDEMKEMETQTITEEENAICRHCHVRIVVRECHQCISRFCMECFVEQHSQVSTIHHTFEVVRAPEARSLVCCHCNERDAKIKDCDSKPKPTHYCEPCFHETHADGAESRHKFLSFKVGTPICIECDEDFAVKSCQECGDVFCHNCCEEVHSYGNMQKHHFTEIEVYDKELLKGDELHCLECDTRRADRICDQCGDWFCENCFAATHSKGRRSRHTWTPWGKGGVSTGWEEFWDEDKQMYVYFNKNTKESRSTKPPELMWGTEREEVIRQQRENLQRARMEEQIQVRRTPFDRTIRAIPCLSLLLLNLVLLLLNLLLTAVFSVCTHRISVSSCEMWRVLWKSVIASSKRLLKKTKRKAKSPTQFPKRFSVQSRRLSRRSWKVERCWSKRLWMVTTQQRRSTIATFCPR